MARWLAFAPGHLAGGATQKVPVIRSQLLDLHLANRSCSCSWSPLGKWDALPHLVDEGVPEYGGELVATGQASHWLLAGTPGPVVLTGPRFGFALSSAFS